MSAETAPVKPGSKSFILLLLLLAAAFAGNFFAYRVFTGFSYLFGSIAVLLVVYLYGVRWGLIAGVIASSWTIVLFGHPYAMIWLCGEPLIVGWLLKKRKSRNIIFYDALYWPFIGAPLVWIFFHYVMQAPLLGTVAASLMYWLIGITNALAASLLLTYSPQIVAIGQQKPPPLIPIHKLIFNLLLAIALIPAMVVMILHGKHTEEKIHRLVYEDMHDSARMALYEVRLRLQKQADMKELSMLPEKLDSDVGGVKTGALREVLFASRIKPFHRLTLIDGANRVIATTGDAVAKEMFEECKNGAIGRPEPEHDIIKCTPAASSSLPLWLRAQESTFVSRVPVLENTGWSVVAETPFAPYQKLLFAEHIQSMLVVLGLNMLAMMASMYASRSLSAPLRKLSGLTTDLPAQLLSEKVPAWSASNIAEIDQLTDNFRAMATALGNRFQEITHARDTLEMRVEERTRELNALNAELQKEILEHRLTGQERDHLTYELVKQVHFLQTIIDAIPNPVFYKDISGLYQGCNRAFEENWLMKRERIVGKSVYELYPVEMADIFYRADQELLARGGVQIYETQMPYKKEGRLHSVLFYKAVYTDAHGEPAGLVGTMIDITDRKLAENERDRLMIELGVKNKELEGIIYIASHDLRSPLINVQGFSRKLAKNCAELEKITTLADLSELQQEQLLSIIRDNIPKSLKFITDSVEKMDSLLNGLVRLSRLGRAALNFEMLDMGLIMEKIIASMTYQFEQASAQVEVGRLDSCFSDAGQVTQVFSNLLDNALKYSAPDRIPRIKIFSEAIQDKIRYCVEDNGVGIDRDHQEQIWDIFHRQNPNDTPGEGLGLTMSKLIVDRLGGMIRVESEPGVGSRFYLLLPKGKPEF